MPAPSQQEMAMAAATSLDELKGITIPILRRHGVLHAGIFGSFARGDQTPQSDIDLLIEFDPGARKSLLDLSALALELEDALGREVDLVTYKSLNPRIRECVLADEVVIL